MTIFAAKLQHQKLGEAVWAPNAVNYSVLWTYHAFYLQKKGPPLCSLTVRADSLCIIDSYIMMYFLFVSYHLSFWSKKWLCHAKLHILPGAFLWLAWRPWIKPWVSMLTLIQTLPGVLSLMSPSKSSTVWKSGQGISEAKWKCRWFDESIKMAWKCRYILHCYIHITLPSLRPLSTSPLWRVQILPMVQHQSSWTQPLSSADQGRGAPGCGPRLQWENLWPNLLFQVAATHHPMLLPSLVPLAMMPKPNTSLLWWCSQ